jgi:hypothetical protein
MKAEHRKELQTNALADRLGRFLQNLKSGKNTTSVVVWVFVLLGLGLFAAWRWHSTASLSTTSALWLRLDAADTVSEFENLAGERGTVASQYARFQMARTLLNRGLQDIYALDQPTRKRAAQDIEKARDQYELLVQEVSEPALLHQEALLGAAKAEEALLGVAREDDAGQPRGNVEKALGYYRTLAQAKPETFLVERAKERVKVLEDSTQKDEFLKVYADLRKQAGQPILPRGMRDPHEGLFPPIPPIPPQQP